MREKRNAYMILMGKPEGKRLLGRPRRRWVDSVIPCSEVDKTLTGDSLTCTK
jgi:hypothetical protein